MAKSKAMTLLKLCESIERAGAKQKKQEKTLAKRKVI